MTTQAFLAPHPQVAPHDEPLPTKVESLPTPDEPDRLRVLLIGPGQSVISTIHILHVLGFAESRQ